MVTRSFFSCEESENYLRRTLVTEGRQQILSSILSVSMLQRVDKGEPRRLPEETGYSCWSNNYIKETLG